MLTQFIIIFKIISGGVEPKTIMVKQITLSLTNQPTLNLGTNFKSSPFSCLFSHETAKDSHQEESEHKRSGKKVIQQWSFEEQKILYEFYEIVGPKWAFISAKLGKKDNASKNRFYGKLRKLLRRLSHVGKYQTKVKKQISYEAIIRPIQAVDSAIQPFENFCSHKNQLKMKIIEYSRKEAQEISSQQAEELIDEIHRFNMLTRSYNLKCRRNAAPEMEKIQMKKNTSVVITNTEKNEQLSERSSSCDDKSQDWLQNFWGNGELMNECMIEEFFNKKHWKYEEEKINDPFGQDLYFQEQKQVNLDIKFLLY